MIGAYKIAGLILAAGLSSRYGKKNKLLGNFNGITMVRAVVQSVIDSELALNILVTGHQSRLIKKEVQDEKLNITYNPFYSSGMGSSIKCGVEAIPNAIDGVVIILGDMPLVKTSTIVQLCKVFLPNSKKDIYVPIFNGKQGNPVLFGRRHFSGLKTIEGDKGGKGIIQDNLDCVTYVETQDNGINIDYNNQNYLPKSSRLVKKN